MLVGVDVDGCLVDSDVPMLRALNHALGSLGLPPVDLDELRPHLGPPLVVTMERLLASREADLGQATELAKRYRQRYASDSITYATAHVGMLEALGVLREAGHDLVVVSSKPPEYSRPILKEVDLLEVFDDVFGPDKSENEPKASTLARALQAFPGIPAVLVGDTVHDISAARSNQVSAIAVSWGYGTRDDLLRAGPTHLIDAPADLATAIEALQSRPL